MNDRTAPAAPLESKGILGGTMGVVTRFMNLLPMKAAHIYLSAESVKNKVKGAGVKDKVLFSSRYDGQKILLMALFEKGNLREDIVYALEAAKKIGAYVICINTLKVSSPERYREFIDCYIEKYNFGRDFGSYKSGFSYIYKNAYEQVCPRVLMLNDSVFYSKKHIDGFMFDMFNTEVDALGATENYEIEHHLGSFCISFSSFVVNSKKFKKYWEKYKNTDVRPVVIKTGEMKLSKILRSVVRSPENFRALYDSTRIAASLTGDNDLLDRALELSRSSSIIPWRRFSLADLTDIIRSKYIHNHINLTSAEVEVSEVDIYFAQSINDYCEFIAKAINNRDSVESSLADSIRRESIASFVQTFTVGSQIHQNNIFLHHMGLAIIKLDGFYRGMFIVDDVEKLACDLDPEQQEAFRRLMYSRPFGGDTMNGWKRIAFLNGLI